MFDFSPELPSQKTLIESESEVAQSYPTLCDPMDCSLPGSSVHGIFQARVLEWGAIAFSECYLYFNVNILLALIGTSSHPMRSGRKGVSPLP